MKRGLAPAAFLVSEGEDSDISSLTSHSSRGKRSSRRLPRSLDFSNGPWTKSTPLDWNFLFFDTHIL